MSEHGSINSSALTAVSGVYLDSLHEQYRHDPSSVDATWRYVFRFLDDVHRTGHGEGASDGLRAALIRYFGHLHATTDPLGLAPSLPDDHLETLARLFEQHGAGIENLQRVYQGGLGVEAAHINDLVALGWIFSHVERARSQPGADAAALSRAYRRVLESDEFESFLMRKFPGKKKFGIEGSEALPVLLDRLFEKAAREGVAEVVVGTMHRGRLNIMANILGKPLQQILSEFKGAHPFPHAPGSAADVPYHLGHEGTLEYGNDTLLRVTLLPNPSHLEAVDPVVLGAARWVQDHRAQADRSKVLVVIVHTDAAVIGQGVVAETIQLSGVDGFTVGGVVHVVVNNQIGFTTEPHEGRASRYCTDAWKAVDSLILHANGEDTGAVLQAADLALAYRQEFARDAIVDLVMYRRNGHNEFDEPRFSQPVMYGTIDNRVPLRAKLRAELLASGGLDEAWEQQYLAAYRSHLDQAYSSISAATPVATPSKPQARTKPVKTGIRREVFLDALQHLAQVPQSLSLNERLAKQVRARADHAAGVNWALAEALAFGSLLTEGVSVRLSGQDVVRGAFSHRHFHLVDTQSGQAHVSLAPLARQGARFDVLNSPLSEYATLGFEYGYGLSAEPGLAIWEAQFGDFANGAQIMIDQFIASGEEKWGQRSGVVLLLPHGLEGQGPEHSSARIERYLQLCAQDNLRLINPSTPANYFQALRQQALSTNKKPLIVFSPKTLLRLPQAVSKIGDFLGKASFQPIIVTGPKAGANRVLLCSGKIAYELEDCRSKVTDTDTIIIRLEQLYPFPEEALGDVFSLNPNARIVWVQEEPENMGAWSWYDRRLEHLARRCGNHSPTVIYCGRTASASPAGSFHGAHVHDQGEIVSRAFRM